MKTDEKITLWSERIHEFQFSGQTCKTWCQEHHVPVSTMNYWMHKLKTLDEQSDTDMIFAKMPTEKEISKNETLNISPSPVRIFITNAIRIIHACIGHGKADALRHIQHLNAPGHVVGNAGIGVDVAVKTHLTV